MRFEDTKVYLRAIIIANQEKSVKKKEKKNPREHAVFTAV